MNALCPIFLEIYPLVTSNTLYVYTERGNESLHAAGDTAPVNFTTLFTGLGEATMKNFD
jgi:hypothetical protein